MNRATTGLTALHRSVLPLAPCALRQSALSQTVRRAACAAFWTAMALPTSAERDGAAEETMRW